MPQPVVRLVTPAHPGDQKHDSRDAFEKQLLDTDGWRHKIDYQAYYGRYDQPTLQTMAQNAVTDAQAAVAANQPAVIVTAGTMATVMVQNQTQGSTIVVIQAAGGAITTPQTNVTGFTINALAIANYHLSNVGSNEVTVLYDDSPDPNPSLYVFEHLQSNGKQITPLPIRFSNPNGLKTLSAGSLKGGFMLLPNAMYYNHLDDIVKYVDGKTVGGNPVSIYYPELEYKKAHTNSTTNVYVYGHDIPNTYVQAAGYVDQVLKGTMSVQQMNLPPIQEALQQTG